MLFLRDISNGDKIPHLLVMETYFLYWSKIQLSHRDRDLTVKSCCLTP